MRQVKSGDTIKVHYHGKLTDGTTFDSSAGREPLEFEVGAGMMIPGSTVVYWEWKLVKRKLSTFPLSKLTAMCRTIFYGISSRSFSARYETRSWHGTEHEQRPGQQFPVVIAEVKEEVVILDGNHPLAGQDLIFDIELMDIAGGSPLIIMP